MSQFPGMVADAPDRGHEEHCTGRDGAEHLGIVPGKTGEPCVAQAQVVRRCLNSGDDTFIQGSGRMLAEFFNCQRQAVTGRRLLCQLQQRRFHLIEQRVCAVTEFQRQPEVPMT